MNSAHFFERISACKRSISEYVGGALRKRILRMSTEGKRAVSWSVSITAGVAMVGAAVLYAADGRYVKSSEFERSMQKMLINHELGKLRVEMAILTERRNNNSLSKKESTELDIKKLYRGELNNTLNRISR